jgi:putative ABC transport system permease protein
MQPSTSLLPAPVENNSESAVVVLPPLKTAGGSTAVLFEVVRISFESLLANRTRSLLTMLGVIIGVASVVTLMSLGQGATSTITNQVQSLGTNLIFVAPGETRNGGPGSSGVAASLTREDANAIAALKLPLNGLAPEFDGGADIVAPAADKSTSVIGVTPPYQSLNSLLLASGSFIDDDAVRSAAAVAVLGSDLATTLFGRGTALGQNVRVNGQSLRVVGVLAAKGGSSFGSVDDRIYVPISLAQQVLFDGRTGDGNSYRLSSITISATNAGDVAGIKTRIANLLRERHHLKQDGSADDFQMFDQKSFLTTLTTITTLLTVFVGAVAGISLLVGGIGIMNIMLVSVTERTREIGLRKAVGAQPSDILLQFIIEAVVISLTGGIIGLLLGGGLVTAVTLSGLFSAPVTLTAVVLSIGFSTAVGLFFGIYPAHRASRLNPIDALRHE